MLAGQNVERTSTLRQRVRRYLGQLDRILNDSAMAERVMLARESR